MSSNKIVLKYSKETHFLKYTSGKCRPTLLLIVLLNLDVLKTEHCTQAYFDLLTNIVRYILKFTIVQLHTTFLQKKDIHDRK